MTKLSTIKMLTIGSLSALALTASIALAQTGTTQNQPQSGERQRHERGRGGRGEGAGRMHGMMFRGLNMTDDQKAKMKEINQGFRANTKSLHEALRAKRQELHQAGAGGTFNEALATQKLQESAGLQAKLMGEQFKMRQAMLTVLTPEQKTQLEQRRSEFEGKRGERGRHKSE
jgi:periplasmic protein CpxP/Spy